MHVARVELRVSDVERSAAFYERIVGLEVRSLSLDEAVLGAPDGGPVRLVLRRAEHAGAAPRRAAGLFHTAFRYAERAALAAALRRVAGERAALSGASDHAVSEALYLDDPDGLGIELYRDRPREQWPPPPPGSRVFMTTIPLDIDDLLSAGNGAAGADGVDVGHVHLKVADVEAAVAFWTGTVGLELMTRYPPDAAFLADEGYHHHVGVNTWLSRGAPLEPREGPGLDRVVIAVGAGAETGERLTPDGLPVLLEPA